MLLQVMSPDTSGRSPVKASHGLTFCLALGDPSCTLATATAASPHGSEPRRRVYRGGPRVIQSAASAWGPSWSPRASGRGLRPARAPGWPGHGGHPRPGAPGRGDAQRVPGRVGGRAPRGTRPRRPRGLGRLEHYSHSPMTCHLCGKLLCCHSGCRPASLNASFQEGALTRALLVRCRQVGDQR